MVESPSKLVLPELTNVIPSGIVRRKPKNDAKKYNKTCDAASLSCICDSEKFGSEKFGSETFGSEKRPTVRLSAISILRCVQKKAPHILAVLLIYTPPALNVSALVSDGRLHA